MSQIIERKKSFAEVNWQIANGTRAIMNGLDYPELKDEIDRQRVHKSELEDVIARKSEGRAKVDPADIVATFNYATNKWDDNLKSTVKFLISKIYAHTDGSYTINVGVHIAGCGGRI